MVWEVSQAIWKLSRLSRNFPDHPETFQSIRKISRLSGNFPDYSETFQVIRKLPRPSRHFLDYPETLQNIGKLSRLSGNFPDHPETFRPSGNFPDHPETSNCNSKGCAQKLSGRAKTFRMAMPRCHECFCASVLKIVAVSAIPTPPYFCWQLAFHRHLPTSGRQNRVKNLLYPPFIYIF